MVVNPLLNEPLVHHMAVSENRGTLSYHPLHYHVYTITFLYMYHAKSIYSDIICPHIILYVT